MKRRKRSQWVRLRGDDIGGRLEERGVVKARGEAAEREVYSTWVKALGSWVGTQRACC